MQRRRTIKDFGFYRLNRDSLYQSQKVDLFRKQETLETKEAPNSEEKPPDKDEELEDEEVGR